MVESRCMGWEPECSRTGDLEITIESNEDEGPVTGLLDGFMEVNLHFVMLNSCCVKDWRRTSGAPLIPSPVYYNIDR